VSVPVALGVNVTEQLLLLPLEIRVQVVELKIPVPLLAKAAVPVGTGQDAEQLGTTVAVQVVEDPALSTAGVHHTVVMDDA